MYFFVIRIFQNTLRIKEKRKKKKTTSGGESPPGRSIFRTRHPSGLVLRVLMGLSWALQAASQYFEAYQVLMYHFYKHIYFCCCQGSIYNESSPPAEHCDVVHFNET